MANKKVYYSIIFLCSLALLAPSCKKKLQKEASTISIKAVNPITGDPYPGVKYEIREYEDGGSSIFSGSNQTESEDSPILTGETDENGIVEEMFYKKKHSDFGYVIYFDFSDMNVPSGDYKVLNKAHFANLYQDLRKHEYEFEIVPFGDFYIHRKNINCLGPSDKMRYRTKWLYTGSSNWTDWTIYNYFEGCIDEVAGPFSQPSDYRVTEMEIIKNGQTTYQVDTFYIKPGVVDTLKMYY